jgi:phosphoglucosamine mutase
VIKFGTDGIRGVANRAPITPETGVLVGRVAARYAAEHTGGRRVLVVRDSRPSGPMLEAAVAAGVLSGGGECRIAGVLPTSAAGTAVAGGLADVAVMITASHNPWTDNGFKILIAGGRKPSDHETALLESMLVDPGSGAECGATRAMRNQVAAMWRSALSVAVGDLSSLAGKRIVIDLAHGAATAAAEWLPQLVPGVELIATGNGRINENVGSEHPLHLAGTVGRRNAWAGFAVDGDGDRCKLVTERGDVVDGDALAWLLASRLGASRLAVTVLSSGALELSLPNVEVMRTAVGDRHLSVAISERGADLGCEESGHVVFRDGLVLGDGLVTGLRALAAAASTGSSLSEALAGYTPIPRRLTKVTVSRTPPLEELGPLQELRASLLPSLGRGGRIFLRYSGTEPVLRLLVEGDSDVRVRDASSRLQRVVEALLA